MAAVAAEPFAVLSVAPIARRKAARFMSMAMSFLPTEGEPGDPDKRSEMAGAPPSAGGHLSLARLARQAGDSQNALAQYREAQFLDPNDAAGAVEHALYLVELGRQRDAVGILERCVRRHPELPAARFHLGTCWGQLAEPAKAAMQLGRYLALDPDDSLGAAAALAGLEQARDELPGIYLRALFDQYADDFDRNLILDLCYRAPQVLRDAVGRCWTAPQGGGTVLDLGCGTGLGGVAFRDMARQLVGIDLSPRMIEKAAVRGLYDGLEIGEAVARLLAAGASWDLIVAADMLVYFGGLDPLLRAAAAALRVGGAFAATAETADGTVPTLKPTRRFGHPESYLRQAATAAGLRIALLEPASVRSEKGQPVPGHVMVLIRDR